MTFQMTEIGRRIAQLRKENNMTQMELADKLGISFQAVSNWERGNSMPDISKLPELAELFGVSIDQLLGEKSQLLTSIAEGKTQEYTRQNEVTLQELADIAPILKPEQVDEVFQDTVQPEDYRDLKEIENLLPFLGKEILTPLAQKALEQDDYRGLGRLAPFLDRETRVQIAQKVYRQDGMRTLGKTDLPPFLPQETLQEIAEMEYQANGLRHFDRIAPFLNRDFLNNLAQKAIERDGIKAISNIAPFLSKEMLSQYVKEKYL